MEFTGQMTAGSGVETHGGQAELELQVPMARGRFSCFCFRKRELQNQSVVLDAHLPRMLLERYANGDAIDRVNSARRIHQMILQRCGSDVEKYQLVCVAAGIDYERPQDGINVQQIISLQAVFDKVFRVPLFRLNADGDILPAPSENLRDADAQVTVRTDTSPTAPPQE